ncbi:hypothetical protein F5Y18DRAFT_394541 [Xylariaceae sp. FL1019]|nr:hypothetical protein F5Y18DRAFT_394541 [Xylariaceae sp. FL1019]
MVGAGGCSSNCYCDKDSDGTNAYCTPDGGASGGSCAVDCDCPAGSFCDSTLGAMCADSSGCTSTYQPSEEQIIQARLFGVMSL